MAKALKHFEDIARNAYKLSHFQEREEDVHPFKQRNIHPELDKVVWKLFDNGHYAHATFDAFKYIEKEVKKLSKLKKLSGRKLMMQAFDEQDPLIQLTAFANKSEQEGYKFMFTGAALAIRNPRGHEITISESRDDCLDHISLASLLLRRLHNRLKTE